MKPREPAPRTLAARLMGISLSAAATALVVTGLALNTAVFLFQKQMLKDDAAAQAKVIAANSVAALVFADRPAAMEAVSSLAHAPWVARATLYDARGEVFADYRRDAAAEPPPPRPQPGVTQEPAALVVASTVEAARGPVGTLRLQVPMAPLYRQVLAFAVITVLVAVVAMLLVWVLVVRLRRDVRRVEQRLDQLAYHDPVTNLFNRHAADEHLARFTEQARARAQGFSIVSFDLDDFKTVNDTLGHAVGDEVLREVARRLTAVLQPDARAYRLGGDEFIVVSTCPQGLEDPAEFAGQVRRALGESLAVDGFEISMSSSVGIARYPADGATAEEVLQASDIAMYRSKALGKNTITVFDASLRDHTRRRMRIESDLRSALREGQLNVVYQPIVDLKDGRIVGAEALVRWQHPVRGPIEPGQFIDVAERTGLVVPLGGWVLAEAARQWVRWRARGLGHLRVAVNVSARQLRGARLVEQFEAAVASAGGAGERLGVDIELTEHSLVENVEENRQVLEALRAFGVRIAIDDFGTGLSSLSYLKQLPVDKLKIDRSFVDGLPEDEGDRAIVGASLSLSHALGLQVVAEGVETVEQLQALRAMGCDFGQGWLFGKPVAPDTFEVIARGGTLAGPLHQEQVTA